MTEKEKAAAGLLYDANYDPAILADRDVADEQCDAYNKLPHRDTAARYALLRELLGTCDENTVIQRPFYCDYGYNIHVGAHFFANRNLVVLDGAPVTFGDHVFVSPNCGFYTAGHPFDVAERNAGLEYAKPITVGSNVWIGAHVCVLPGVTIGDNAVIAAGSVVTRDVPPYVLAGGTPCRVLRELERPRRIIL